MGIGLYTRREGAAAPSRLFYGENRRREKVRKNRQGFSALWDDPPKAASQPCLQGWDRFVYLAARMPPHPGGFFVQSYE